VIPVTERSDHAVCQIREITCGRSHQIGDRIDSHLSGDSEDGGRRLKDHLVEFGDSPHPPQESFQLWLTNAWSSPSRYGPFFGI
jgi:hypothetical protein